MNLYLYVLQGYRVAAKFEIKEEQRREAVLLPEIPVSTIVPHKDGRRFRVVVVEAESEVLASMQLRASLSTDAVKTVLRKNESGNSPAGHRPTARH